MNAPTSDSSTHLCVQVVLARGHWVCNTCMVLNIRDSKGSSSLGLILKGVRPTAGVNCTNEHQGRSIYNVLYNYNILFNIYSLIIIHSLWVVYLVWAFYESINRMRFRPHFSSSWEMVQICFQWNRRRSQVKHYVTLFQLITNTDSPLTCAETSSSSKAKRNHRKRARESEAKACSDSFYWHMTVSAVMSRYISSCHRHTHKQTTTRYNHKVFLHLSVFGEMQRCPCISLCINEI